MTERTESARQALDQYCQCKGESLDTETAIIDLLADLLHLAWTEGLDARNLGKTALMHFVAETEI